MIQLILIDPPPALLAHVAAMYQRGYQVVLLSRDHVHCFDHPLASCTMVVVVGLYDSTPLGTLATVLRQHGLPWIGWNTHDDALVTLSAYQAGALMVLPAAADAALLTQAAQHAHAPQHRARNGAVIPVSHRRHYRRDALITLPDDTVLEIEHGVVAHSVVHADGKTVLLGLFGPGMLLPAHPHDACCIEVIAHTDTTARLHPWHSVIHAPDVAERFRARIWQMEAWSSMQARPYLDQRLLGVLSLLAEQFGVPHASGVLVDVRITHVLLASAIGATRTTVTRLLGDLRTRGLISIVGTGRHERFCLHTWEVGDHTSGLLAREVGATR